MTFSISSSADIDAASWDAYVNGSPGASLYHLYGWKKVVEDTFGHRTRYLLARGSASEILGVLPLVELKSRMFGRMLVSMPFFNYGGILAANDEARRALLAAAIEAAKEIRANFLEIRDDEDWNQELPRKTSKVSMRLPLPGDPADLWKGLGSKLRNQIQRPRKEGMTATVGGEELLDAFYDVFAANMRDLGTPVYSRSFFRNILRQFPDRTWIACVRAGDTPVAAGFLAGFNSQLEIPWASSLRAYNRQSPNMLLYWQCLEFACQRGFKVFDFGRSTMGESTFKFKEQWGAKPHQLYWHYWLPTGGDIPQVNPSNRKYEAAIGAWRRLPLPVTRWLGPKIVKYIP